MTSKSTTNAPRQKAEARPKPLCAQNAQSQTERGGPPVTEELTALRVLDILFASFF